MSILTHAELLEKLRYDEASSVFVWRISPRMNVRSGSVAGMLNSQGYRVVKINSRGYMAHRLAWFYSTGAWPKEEIDHVNGLRDDNRLGNLRESSRANNNKNVGKRNDNTSGRKGVTWHKRQGCWTAQIQKDGKKMHLGTFDSVETASAVYEQRAMELFGCFARRTA